MRKNDLRTGHLGAENPIVDTLLDLHHKLWRYCGQTGLYVGISMYELAVTAQKKQKPAYSEKIRGEGC